MKHWARKSKSAIIAFKVYQNWRMKRRLATGDIETEHGSSHSSKSLAESISYIEEQFADYLKYGELSPADLPGKRILELGFGDNVGVALLFLASGAERVVCVDRFLSKRDSDQEREIYATLRDRLGADERRRFDEAIDITEKISFNATRLSSINGLDLENAVATLQLEPQSFDLIISRAVIEEVFEPEPVFAAADKLLAPGGLMLHKIDLSDYGIFSEGGMHALTFLTIPESVYRLMSTDSGIPNRKLIGYYKEQMAKLGYDARFLVTSLVGHGPVVPHRELGELNGDQAGPSRRAINEIRPRLSPEYRALPDDELMISGVFLVARKPLSGKEART